MARVYSVLPDHEEPVVELWAAVCRQAYKDIISGYDTREHVLAELESDHLTAISGGLTSAGADIIRARLDGRTYTHERKKGRLKRHGRKS